MRADPEKFTEMLATLDREGWSQGESDAAPCLIQSGWRHPDGFTDYLAFADSPESDVLVDVIYDQFLDRVYSNAVTWRPARWTVCHRFNDHPYTTETDVRAVIEITRARARVEEQA
jgi:hypothetical protein